MSDESLRAALEKLQENWSLAEIVQAAIRDAEWCCEVGCGSGACETCPCCCAGYCVSGRDGLPNDDPEAAGLWLEIAAEHNPAIASLRPLLLAAYPAESVPVADRERLARILDPDIFDETIKRSTRQVAQIQIAARQHMAYEGADRLLAAGVFRSEAVALDREAVEIAARAKIAEWYGTEWNARDDRFYETDDGGATGDEDSEAMLELRGARLALDEAAKLARPEAVVKAEAAERIAQAIEDYQHALEDAFEKRGHEADEIRADAAENCATIARQFGPGRADEMEEES